MNWDQIEGKWHQWKGAAQKKWGELTNDELDRAQGNQEQLAGLIQEKYGKTKEAARKEVNDWANSL